VFLRRGEAFLAGIKEVVAGGGPPLDQLLSVVAFEVGFFRAHPDFGRLYLRTASLSRPLPGGGDGGQGLATFEETMAVQVGLVRDGQEAGAIRPGDPEALLGLLSGLVLAYIAVDPTVTSGGADATERLPLQQFLRMVAGALGRG
jgi:hypothetical protein